LLRCEYLGRELPKDRRCDGNAATPRSSLRHLKLTRKRPGSVSTFGQTRDGAFDKPHFINFRAEPISSESIRLVNSPSGIPRSAASRPNRDSSGLPRGKRRNDNWNELRFRSCAEIRGRLQDKPQEPRIEYSAGVIPPVVSQTFRL
jgi:hypothetical protein